MLTHFIKNKLKKEMKNAAIRYIKNTIITEVSPSLSVITLNEIN